MDVERRDGALLRRWDGRGHALRWTNDALRRPLELLVTKNADPEVLAERTVWGDGHVDALAKNLRGRPFQRYDGAGVVTSEAYDFKGNLLASSRRLRSDYASQVALSLGNERTRLTGRRSFGLEAVLLSRSVSAPFPDASGYRRSLRCVCMEPPEMRNRCSCMDESDEHLPAHCRSLGGLVAFGALAHPVGDLGVSTAHRRSPSPTVEASHACADRRSR